MRVALFQMNIIWEDKQSNYFKVENAIVKARKEKCNLFLLPEMSFTGFSMNIDRTKEIGYETLTKIRKWAVENQIMIGFGWVKGVGQKAENHYTIVDDKGKTLIDYIKIHPFSYSGEDKKFEGGAKIDFFTIGNTCFSVFICYDLRFPDVFQIASQKATVMIIPANWPEKRRNHWKSLLQARAIENQCYIFAVNCVGKCGDLYYSGDSCIINPNGDIIKTVEDKEELIIYDFKDDADNYRENFPTMKDRRQELYCMIRSGNN